MASHFLDFVVRCPAPARCEPQLSLRAELALTTQHFEWAKDDILPSSQISSSIDTRIFAFASVNACYCVVLALLLLAVESEAENNITIVSPLHNELRNSKQLGASPSLYPFFFSILYHIYSRSFCTSKKSTSMPRTTAARRPDIGIEFVALSLEHRR